MKWNPWVSMGRTTFKDIWKQPWIWVKIDTSINVEKNNQFKCSGGNKNEVNYYYLLIKMCPCTLEKWIETNWDPLFQLSAVDAVSTSMLFLGLIKIVNIPNLLSTNDQCKCVKKRHIFVYQSFYLITAMFKWSAWCLTQSSYFQWHLCVEAKT